MARMTSTSGTAVVVGVIVNSTSAFFSFFWRSRRMDEEGRDVFSIFCKMYCTGRTEELSVSVSAAVVCRIVLHLYTNSFTLSSLRYNHDTSTRTPSHLASLHCMLSCSFTLTTLHCLIAITLTTLHCLITMFDICTLLFTPSY